MTDSPVDWDAAVRTGRRLAPTGPRVDMTQARAVVDELRGASKNAELRVRETTGLGADLPIAECEVVDRPGWITATAEGMAELSAPLTARLPATGSSRRVAGSEVGAVLAYLSGRVLGQYDPIGGGGRLLLVAPNILKVEREIAADTTDFRLWVCLHESTHRLQFSANPWLVTYFRGLVDEFAAVAPTDMSGLIDGLSAAIRGRSARSRDAGPREPGDSWIRRMQTPEQRAVFDKLMALMTLLEGHADYVMDAVGPRVVPTVAAIRASFSERRRKGRGPIDRIVRTILGMDVKLAQYAAGAAFVREVVDAVGMERFNRVFDAPEMLPGWDEIHHARDWIARTVG